MPEFITIDAPSILGLKPTGVERLPEALKAAGILESLRSGDAGRIEPPPYDPRRDEKTHLLNPTGIHDYSRRLATAVGGVLDGGRFPVVLGGDCSILIGCMLALRRLGRYGLFFADGHADFYLPEQSETGEAADSDLALVSGRGPEKVTDIDDLQRFRVALDQLAYGDMGKD